VRATREHQFGAGLETRERDFVEPKRTVNRVPAQAGDRRALADDEPRLRAAEQFVAREHDDVHARRDRVPHERFAAQDVRERRRAVRLEQSRSEIEGTRDLPTQAEFSELRRRRFLGESDDAEVARVDLDQEARALTDRALVVRDPGAIRGPDLDEARVRTRHDVRHAEAATDLDQLAAREDRFASARERVEEEQHGAGAVVHADARLRAGESREEIAEVIVTLVALVRLAVDLEHAVAARRSSHRFGDFVVDRRATETGVQDDARRVDAAHDAAPFLARDAPLELDEGLPRRAQGHDAIGVEAAGRDLRAPRVQGLGREVTQEVARGPRLERDDARIAQRLVDGRKEAVGSLRIGGGAGHPLLCPLRGAVRQVRDRGRRGPDSK